MIWTKRKPTKVGWWWYRPDTRVEPDIVKIIDRVTYWVLFTSGRAERIANLHGEWSSEPIQEPKEA